VSPMPFLTQDYLRKLRWQKVKYFKKVIDPDAVYANWLRTFDTWEVFRERMLEELTLANYYNISFILLFAEDPPNLEPISFDFEFQLPDVEDVIAGIYAVFNKVKLEVRYTGMQDYTTFVDYNIKPEYREDAKRAKEIKARYGVTYYGEGVYDPPQVSEFVRNAILKRVVEHTDMVFFREWLEEMARKLGIGDELKETIYHRIMLVDVATQGPFILGFSRLGEGWLVPEGHEFEKVVLQRYEGDTVEVRVKQSDDVHMGFILGVSRLGFDFLVPRDSVFLKPMPQVLDVVRYKEREMLNRYVHTAGAFGNYVTGRELTNPHRCERVHQWHTLRLYMLFAEEVARRVCAKYCLDTYTTNNYMCAARNLLALGLRRHRWGEKAYSAMSLDELKEVWLAKWEKAGLKREILEEIYRGMEPWLARLRYLKWEVGKSVAEKRRLRATLLKLSAQK